MLGRKDFEQKQIVIISSDEYKNLNLKNDNIVIIEKEKVINQISCAKIFCIFIIGDFSITSKIIKKCMEYQICIYHISAYNLKPRFVIWNTLEGNYLLRQKQYGLNDELEIKLAKQIVKNKCQNQIFLLKNIRDKSEELKQIIKNLENNIEKIELTENHDSLRGIEWGIAKSFFGEYFKEIWRHKRMPRTRNDIPNFLMDMWYTFIYNFVEANLNLYGFDIYKWFYHKLFFERKSLVCDLVEPFRCIIDHKIRKIYNLWQVNEKDFVFKQWEYNLSWEKNKIYTKYFLEEIMANKEQIFKYIKNFYKMMMKWEFTIPVFDFGQ